MTKVRFSSWYLDDDGSKLRVWGTCTRARPGSRETPPEGPEVLTLDDIDIDNLTEHALDQIHENLEVDDVRE